MGFFFQSSIGTFTDRPSIEINASQDPVEIAVSDLDGDGRNDVAVASSTGKALEIFLQGPCGDWEEVPSARIPLPGAARSVLAGDLNGDGKNDLAGAVAMGNERGSIQVFFQRGEGAFPAKADLDLFTDKNPTGLAAGDLDGDGFNDLAVTAAPASDRGTLHLFLQRERGLLGACGADGSPCSSDLTLDAGRDPQDVAVGDVNGDGLADIALASSKGSLFLREPAGLDPEGKEVLAFREAILRKPDGSATAISMGDLNGDGLNDLVVANAASARLSLYYQKRDSQGRASIGIITAEASDSSSPDVTLFTTEIPGSIAVSDLNGDGRNDLVVAVPSNHTLQFFLAR